MYPWTYRQLWLHYFDTEENVMILRSVGVIRSVFFSKQIVGYLFEMDIGDNWSVNHTKSNNVSCLCVQIRVSYDQVQILTQIAAVER